jgi:hypothetical protein
MRTKYAAVVLVLPFAFVMELSLMAKGGYCHHGRYPTLLAVVQHYNQTFNLRMTGSEMSDLAEYLKSL